MSDSKRCDKIVTPISVSTTPTLVQSETCASGTAPMQKERPFSLRTSDNRRDTEGDFGPGEAKMSKDASTLVLGSRELVNWLGEGTNSSGLHIYSRNVGKTSKSCASQNSKNEWSFVQSLTTDNDDEPLQIVQAHVSADGSGILALSKPWCNTLSWTTEGDADWIVQGDGSLQSGVIADGQTSSLVLDNVCDQAAVRFVYSITSDDDQLAVLGDNALIPLIDEAGFPLANPIVGTVGETFVVVSPIFGAISQLKWTYSQTGGGVTSANVKDITINTVAITPTMLPQRAALPQTKLHWFERDPLACARAGVATYTLHQTFTNDVLGVEWHSFTADENQTRIVLYKKGVNGESDFADGALDVYKRSVTTTKRKSQLALPEDALFAPVQTIEIDSEDGAHLNGIYALCDDASTLVVATEYVESGSVFSNQIHQYDYDCEAGEYESVSIFDTEDNFKQLVDLKLGGLCCDRLFLLLRNAFDQMPTYSVEVYDRRTPAQLARKQLVTCDCSDEQLLFSEETLVTTITDAVEPVNGSLSKPVVSLFADPIDGDSFVVFVARPKVADNTGESFLRKGADETAFNMRFWRQSAKDRAEWKYRNPSAAEMAQFPDARCYDTHAFANLVFDHECQRYCFPMVQRFYLLTDDRSKLQYVFYKNGEYFLNETYIGSFEEDIFYRNPGTQTWLPTTSDVVNFRTVPNPVDLSAQCDATQVEVIDTLNGLEYNAESGAFILTKRDPNVRPDIIQAKYAVPLRLFFHVVCFQKN